MHQMTLMSLFHRHLTANIFVKTLTYILLCEEAIQLACGMSAGST